MANITGLLSKYHPKDDERFFKDIFNDAEYAEARGRTDLIVLDVGALAGEFSAYIYDQAKIIYAIEPIDFAELEENVQEFGLDKVKCFNLALFKYNGEVSIELKDRGGHSINENSREGTKTQLVKCKTLATFMKDEGIDHIDVLKTDTENAEKAIFNADDFTEIAPKIDLIIGEHLEELNDRFSSLGFKNVHLDKGWLFIK